MLAKSGKAEQAPAEFNHAIEFDPNNAQALYGRGMLYEGEKQHEQRSADFAAADGLKPQQARGQAYERLGDKSKTAESYGRAINLRPRDEAAPNGLTRVRGRT